jgi:hypothetical protein
LRDRILFFENSLRKFTTCSSYMQYVTQTSTSCKFKGHQQDPHPKHKMPHPPSKQFMKNLKVIFNPQPGLPSEAHFPRYFYDVSSSTSCLWCKLIVAELVGSRMSDWRFFCGRLFQTWMVPMSFGAIPAATNLLASCGTLFESVFRFHSSFCSKVNLTLFFVVWLLLWQDHDLHQYNYVTHSIFWLYFSW